MFSNHLRLSALGAMDDTDLYEFAVATVLAPVIAGGIMLGWIETLGEGDMSDPNFTIDQISRLMSMRGILLKILRGPNPEKEIIEWAMRGGKAEVIRLDDFRTDRPPANRRDAAGS